MPEGTRVKKGQVVCELDSARLKDQLVNQMIAVKRAEAAYQNAKLTREVAEIAVTEYVEGIYKQEQDTLKGEIVTAETAIQKAEARLERTRRARKRMNDVLAANRGATHARRYRGRARHRRPPRSGRADPRARKMALGLAKNKRDVLEKYTCGKTIKELKVDVERKRSDELAKKATWELEKGKEAKLEQADRRLHARRPDRRTCRLCQRPEPARPASPQIEEGATVRERQKIFRISDLDGPMQVNTKVPESMVDQLKLGLRARITVDAFPGEMLAGLVSDVAPLPDASSRLQSRSRRSTPPRSRSGGARRASCRA